MVEGGLLVCAVAGGVSMETRRPCVRGTTKSGDTADGRGWELFYGVFLYRSFGMMDNGSAF